MSQTYKSTEIDEPEDDPWDVFLNDDELEPEPERSDFWFDDDEPPFTNIAVDVLTA